MTRQFPRNSAKFTRRGPVVEGEIGCGIRFFAAEMSFLILAEGGGFHSLIL